MSWDATLYSVTEIKNCTECGHELDKPRQEQGEIEWWNYTHNTSRMIYDVLEGAGIELAEHEAWWKRLDGMTGSEGKEYLATIIKGLEADPNKYRAMDPPNKWGSYLVLLEVLRKMHDAIPADEASVWHASG